MSKQSLSMAIFIVCLLNLSVLSLDVFRCSGTPVPNIKPFSYTTNGTKDDTTSAYMCHDDQFLHVYWFNIDN